MPSIDVGGYPSIDIRTPRQIDYGNQRQDKAVRLRAVHAEARVQMSREIRGLDHDQLVRWFASLEYSDPALARLAKKFREDQATADAKLRRKRD